VLLVRTRLPVLGSVLLAKTRPFDQCYMYANKAATHIQRTMRFRRVRLNATRIQSWARVLLVKARLFYLGQLGRMHVAAVHIQSVIHGWRIRKRCWSRAK
jgi:hypothetical protein